MVYISCGQIPAHKDMQSKIMIYPRKTEEYSTIFDLPNL